MSTTITPSFVQQWSNEVKQAFQQKGTKILANVKTAYDVTGSSYNFHKLASVTANTKIRDAEITALDAASSVVTATLADFYAGIYIDKLDEAKTNASLRQEYVTAASNAIGRKVDDVIVTALALASTTTTTVTGGLTLAKILEGLTYLNTNDVDPDDRILLIGSQQLTDALGIAQLTSTDYVQVQGILNAGIGKALGFTWVLSNRLPLAVKNRTCFAYSKQAVGAAIGMDITSEMNYIPQRVATLVNSFVSLGSVVIENAGITKITCVEP